MQSADAPFWRKVSADFCRPVLHTPLSLMAADDFDLLEEFFFFATLAAVVMLEKLQSFLQIEEVESPKKISW